MTDMGDEGPGAGDVTARSSSDVETARRKIAARALSFREHLQVADSLVPGRDDDQIRAAREAAAEAGRLFHASLELLTGKDDLGVALASSWAHVASCAFWYRLEVYRVVEALGATLLEIWSRQGITPVELAEFGHARAEADSVARQSGQEPRGDVNTALGVAFDAGDCEDCGDCWDCVAKGNGEDM